MHSFVDFRFSCHNKTSKLGILSCASLEVHINFGIVLKMVYGRIVLSIRPARPKHLSTNAANHDVCFLSDQTLFAIESLYSRKVYNIPYVHLSFVRFRQIPCYDLCHIPLLPTKPFRSRKKHILHQKIKIAVHILPFQFFYGFHCPAV